MTEPSVGRIVLLENNGPVGLTYGKITKVWDDDGGHKNLVDVTTEDQNSAPLVLFKIPKKAERGERDITPSWSWFWPPDSPAVEAELSEA